MQSNGSREIPRNGLAAKLVHQSVITSTFTWQTAVGLLIGIAVLYVGRQVLIPIALAVLLSFLLAPPMMRLQRLGLGKTFAALFVVVLSFSALVAIGWAGFGQAYNLTAELPQYRQNISTKLRALNPRSLSDLGKTKQMLGEVTEELIAQDQAQKSNKPSSKIGEESSPPSGQRPIPVQVKPAEPTPVELMQKTAGSLLQPLATTFIVLVFVVFMLLGREDLRDRLLRLAGSSRLYLTTQVLDDAARRVSRYLLMQFAVNVVYGALVGLGLLLIGVPHPLVWAVLATVFRFIPYVGPWIAAAGPLLLAIGVAPGWSKFAWTLGLYGVLELVAANFVEPFLYGSSTGISAIAILVAAVFWTWLWGPIGLLLSTPLTVCVVVIGRYVPHLEFLGILFGDEPALSPAQRFYQRMIAMDAEDAAELVEQLLKDQSVLDVYDSVIIPAMSLAEEGRHAGFLDSATEAYFLENTRELVEEIGAEPPARPNENRATPKVFCLPAKDAADEVAAEMFVQLLRGTTARVLPIGISTDDLVQTISAAGPDVLCISGVPPQATRRVAVRCRHLRTLFPDLGIMAAVWSDADLTSVRARIPVSDANHVVCTFKQAIDYVSDIAKPGPKLVQSPSSTEDDKAAEHLAALESPEISDAPLQEVLDHIVQETAKSLDTPMAVLKVTTETGTIWKSQCGLPADLAPGADGIEQLLGSFIEEGKSTVVIADIVNDHRFAESPFVQEKGIHFCAAEPLMNRNDELVGILLVLDTRPRGMSEREKELLHNSAAAALEALELRAVAPAIETSIGPLLSNLSREKPLA
jgi:predicted PurR-regulated permease PerM